MLSYGTILGSDPNLKEPYPQIIPKYTHGGCASQAYILRAFQGERAFRTDQRYQTYDLGIHARFLDEEILEEVMHLTKFMVLSISLVLI
jgi:hypothetical protein